MEANYQSLNRSVSSSSHHVADEIQTKIKIKEQFKQQLANGEFNFAVSSDHNPYDDSKSQVAVDPYQLRQSINSATNLSQKLRSSVSQTRSRRGSKLTTTSSQTRNTGITNKSAEGRRPPKPASMTSEGAGANNYKIANVKNESE